MELATITPGMLGQYLAGLGGSPANRNLHLSALCGLFDRLVPRHVVILNPAASVKGVKDTVFDGKTPKITIDQSRTLLASVDTGHVVGLRDRAILATLDYTGRRGGAVAKLRLGDFQHDGSQSVLRFQEKGGMSREIPVRHDPFYALSSRRRWWAVLTLQNQINTSNRAIPNGPDPRETESREASCRPRASISVLDRSRAHGGLPVIRRLLAQARRMKMKVVKPLGRDCPSDLVKVSLCDENPEVAQTLAQHFRDADGVEVLAGNLFDLDCDALISPANSFGDMSGGIDQQIDRFYNEAAQRATMSRIAERFHGELPVGVATIIAMGSRRFPFLIVSPTMRVPSRVSGTLNAYLSMRAALVAILDHNKDGLVRIRSVAVPGLCTGVGGMPADEAGPQMRAAYDMVVLGGWRQIVHPIQAPFALGLGFALSGRRQRENPESNRQ